MHASQHNQIPMTVPAAPGTERKSRNTMRLTFATNGTFFEIQGDIRKEGGVKLHLVTDGDSAELTIQSDEGDAAFPALRIHSERSA